MSDGGWSLVRTVSGFFQQNRNYLTIKSGIHPCVYFVFPTLPFFSPMSSSVCLSGCVRCSNHLHLLWPRLCHLWCHLWQWPLTKPRWGLTVFFFSVSLFYVCLFVSVCQFQGWEWFRKDPGSCLFVCVVCRDSGGLARTPNNSGLGFVSACFYARFFFQLGSRSCEKGRLPASMTSSPMAAAFDDTPVRPHLFFAGKRGRWVMEDEA